MTSRASLTISLPRFEKGTKRSPVLELDIEILPSLVASMLVQRRREDEVVVEVDEVELDSSKR